MMNNFGEIYNDVDIEWTSAKEEVESEWKFVQCRGIFLHVVDKDYKSITMGEECELSEKLEGITEGLLKRVTSRYVEKYGENVRFNIFGAFDGSNCEKGFEGENYWPVAEEWQGEEVFDKDLMIIPVTGEGMKRNGLS